MTADQAILVLEDGMSFVGKPLGAAARTHGEVVFVNGIGPRISARGGPALGGEIRGMDGSAW